LSSGRLAERQGENREAVVFERDRFEPAQRRHFRRQIGEFVVAGVEIGERGELADFGRQAGQAAVADGEFFQLAQFADVRRQFLQLVAAEHERFEFFKPLDAGEIVYSCGIEFEVLQVREFEDIGRQLFQRQV